MLRGEKRHDPVRFDRMSDASCPNCGRADCLRVVMASYPEVLYALKCGEKRGNATSTAAETFNLIYSFMERAAAHWLPAPNGIVLSDAVLRLGCGRSELKRGAMLKMVHAVGSDESQSISCEYFDADGTIIAAMDATFVTP